MDVLKANGGKLLGLFGNNRGRTPHWEFCLDCIYHYYLWLEILFGYLPTYIHYVCQHHGQPLPARQFVAAAREQPKEQGTGYEDCEIYNAEPRDGKRFDGGAHTQNKEDIEDVAADDIANGQSALSLTCCHDACGKFG